MTLTTDQRALLHRMVDAADGDATLAALVELPGPVQVELAGHVQWMHNRLREAHEQRRERIVAGRKETRHG